MAGLCVWRNWIHAQFLFLLSLSPMEVSSKRAVGRFREVVELNKPVRYPNIVWMDGMG